MSSQNLTFRLFRKRPSFIDGISSLFDLSTVAQRYHVNKTGSEADIKSLEADWLAIGKDMQEVMEKYERTAESPITR